MTKKALFVIASFALVFFLAAALPAAAEDHPLIGQKAPAFTLKNYDGNDVSLADYAGKHVMVVFWFPT